MEAGANEKCSCDKAETGEGENSSRSDSSNLKEKRYKISLFNIKKGIPIGRKNKKSQNGSDGGGGIGIIKKSPKWGIKFSCSKKEPKVALSPEGQSSCMCTCFRRVEEEVKEVVHEEGDMKRRSEEVDGGVEGCEGSAADGENGRDGVEVSSSGVAVGAVAPANGNGGESEDDPNRGIYGTANAVPNFVLASPFADMQWIRNINEDCDTAARIARAREIEQGVEAPANFKAVKRVQLLCSDVPEADSTQSQAPRRFQLVCPPDLSVDTLRALFQNHVTLRSCPLDTITGCHTQVDFIHCLVPDLLSITNCSFYWGKMDRYEAERLLEGKPEGTFLLRDSAQEEFLFSVSFRKYGRSLHARIEQWNHKFSFDSHDPGVYTSDTVCGLMERYKDPSNCMFFEPMLTWPLHRNFTFSLQHLARAVVVTRLTYDNINHLQLPKTLKNYLKEYHYRQKVRVERFDDDVEWLELRNAPS